jgi:hypothetical protein
LIFNGNIWQGFVFGWSYFTCCIILSGCL